MQPLADYLQAQGYGVINTDYPSTKYSLEELTERIHKKLADKFNESKPVHFIGYSMGGLLVRAYLHKYRPAHLGKVVLLGSPNHGSEIADFLKDNWLYKKFYGPAGQQLTTNNKTIEKFLGRVDYELGIIAGKSTIDPISSTIIGGDDDGKVSIKSTKLEGMRDHIVVSATHTFFPSNKDVQKQTLYFLKYGVFMRPKA
jgi:esterase/lipase